MTQYSDKKNIQSKRVLNWIMPH